ncbi:MAG: ABC transporter substrate-binding protein, partial [Pseudomonadota bacterium]
MSFILRCLAAVIVLVAAGCGQSPSEDVLRRGNGGDPGTLNPSLAEDVHAFEVLADLYEGLVVPGPGGAILPGVAESWTIGDAGITYTFHLNERARWSDGEPVVAEDFVRRFRDVAAPGSTSPLGFLLAPIEHFDAVRAAEMPPESLGIVAV